MPGIDLYAIYGLDRTHPPEALAAQLTAQLNTTDPRDTLGRNRIDTARAILGDPQRRAAYDAQLSDPSAPPITEQVLALIAGRPMPTAPRSGLAAAFATTRVRVLAGVAAALALALVVSITAIACSAGGDDSGNTASTTASGNSTGRDGGSTGASSVSCQYTGNRLLDAAKWTYTDQQPTKALLVDKAIDLPPQFAHLADFTTSSVSGPGWEEGLVQLQNHDIAVRIINGAGIVADRSFGNSWGIDEGVLTETVVTPDGTVASTRDLREKAPGQYGLQAPSDLARGQQLGYYRMQGIDGVTLPAAAAGDETNKYYALSVMADAYQQSTVWLLLRGSSALYRSTIVLTTNDGVRLGAVIDPTKCTN
ncbi:hypothetical protein GII30_02535 [Gordonia amarae]|uniref:J domain-containing protein n=2 Tax=Gordonia amarae TaxID=36821 RepID=G7GN35_9ACTN|nr:hypothetical protein [Gordonia amarae]MCS3877234.1 hypothetical protein [Gordonia amarae]QHN16014.1 hypothetical protein GII35_02560 [Gordonia amarae]QHN20583.1 hypothetical protein GII34_02560 [Gordonia amarae]QHN29434.1 hypothetical protein GII32_02565 [Gordonia amarae]QHN38204.1 hypothetical protein GII30_02535 [Gordonia amarae]